MSQPFPHFQKECGALHAFCVELENAHEFILAANAAQEHNKSWFMNMIDYYLLEAVVSFCIQTKTAASFSEVSHVPFSAPAGQVAQHYK